MAASYPSGFDSMSDPGANLSTNPHSTMHNQINDVIEAVEAELGLSPSGASATVTARFTADEALISKSYTVCTSGTRPSSPTEGDKIFETDTNKILVYSSAAWSSIGPVHGALTAWTPAIVQGVSVTSTTNTAVCFRVGRLVTAFFVITATSNGTAANVVTVTLPVAADAGWVSDYATLGAGAIYDGSASVHWGGFATIASTTTLKFRGGASGASPPLFLGGAGSNFTAALASSDILSATITYPAGSDA